MLVGELDGQRTVYIPESKIVRPDALETALDRILGQPEDKVGINKRELDHLIATLKAAQEGRTPLIQMSGDVDGLSPFDNFAIQLDLIRNGWVVGEIGGTATLIPGPRARPIDFTTVRDGLPFESHEPATVYDLIHRGKTSPGVDTFHHSAFRGMAVVVTHGDIASGTVTIDVPRDAVRVLSRSGSHRVPLGSDPSKWPDWVRDGGEGVVTIHLKVKELAALLEGHHIDKLSGYTLPSIGNRAVLLLSCNSGAGRQNLLGHPTDPIAARLSAALHDRLVIAPPGLLLLKQLGAGQLPCGYIFGTDKSLRVFGNQVSPTSAGVPIAPSPARDRVKGGTPAAPFATGAAQPAGTVEPTAPQAPREGSPVTVEDVATAATGVGPPADPAAGMPPGQVVDIRVLMRTVPSAERLLECRAGSRVRARLDGGLETWLSPAEAIAMVQRQARLRGQLGRTGAPMLEVLEIRNYQSADFPRTAAQAREMTGRGVCWDNDLIRDYYQRLDAEVAGEMRRIQSAGATLEAQARRAFDMRRDARLTARAMMGDLAEVERLRARDVEKYGYPDGPTFEQLMKRQRTHDRRTGADAYRAIIESSRTLNPAYNTALGRRLLSQLGPPGRATEALVQGLLQKFAELEGFSR
jgi:hypothetical protein